MARIRAMHKANQPSTALHPDQKPERIPDNTRPYFHRGCYRG